MPRRGGGALSQRARARVGRWRGIVQPQDGIGRQQVNTKPRHRGACSNRTRRRRIACCCLPHGRMRAPSCGCICGLPTRRRPRDCSVHSSHGRRRRGREVIGLQGTRRARAALSSPDADWNWKRRCLRGWERMLDGGRRAGSSLYRYR